MDYQEIRCKLILDALHRIQAWTSVRWVSTVINISWVTAKRDLEYLAKEGIILRKEHGKSYLYKFNPEIEVEEGEFLDQIE